jgi:hypothetical protein
MIFGLSDSGSTTMILAAFGTFNAIVMSIWARVLKRIDARTETNAAHLADIKVAAEKLEHHTDGMQETIERLAEAKGIMVGGAQVRSDIQLGVQSTERAGPGGTK